MRNRQTLDADRFTELDAPTRTPTMSRRRSCLELQFVALAAVLVRRSAGDDDESIRRHVPAAAAEVAAQEFPADPWSQETFVSVVQATVDELLTDWDEEPRSAPRRRPSVRRPCD